MDESNFEKYLPKVGHLIDKSMSEGMKEGTIKFMINKHNYLGGGTFCGTE